jgi:hypothetical protein
MGFSAFENTPCCLKQVSIANISKLCLVNTEKSLSNQCCMQYLLPACTLALSTIDFFYQNLSPANEVI